MIQDKNVENFCISQLEKEIAKNEKIRKALDNETKLIMLFMVRSKVMFAGEYKGGSNIEGIQLHDNTSVIIPKEEEIFEFLGERNKEALVKLSRLSQQDSL